MKSESVFLHKICSKDKNYRLYAGRKIGTRLSQNVITYNYNANREIIVGKRNTPESARRAESRRVEKRVETHVENRQVSVDWKS